MRNIGNIIKSHNNNILNHQDTTPDVKSCNCRKEPCPLDNNCLVSSIIYKASVKVFPGSDVKNYYGLAEGDFKQRYRTHKCAIQNSDYPCQTALSKYIWEIKNQNKQYEVAWSIMSKGIPYRSGSDSCDLCTTEKLFIATESRNNLINKKSEIVSCCPHRAKFLLYNVDKKYRRKR